LILIDCNPALDLTPLSTVAKLFLDEDDYYYNGLL